MKALATDGVIVDNVIAFNQSFNQGRQVSGGGIYIGGGAAIGAANLSPAPVRSWWNPTLFRGTSQGLETAAAYA